MQDYIYSVIALLAIVIHLIINFDMLPGRKVSHIRCAHEYRCFLGGLLYYYIMDACWGVFAGLGWTKILYLLSHKEYTKQRMQGECRTMPARKPYQKMLKLPKHWKISRIEHRENGSRVDLWLKHKPHTFLCSKCHEPATTYAHMEERVFQHPDTSERRLFLHIRRPLVSCHEHGIIPGKFFAEGYAESN